MSAVTRTLPLIVAVAALSLDCATLDPISSGTCGNGVVDADEDCDSFPAQCGAPGAGALACRVACGDGKPACPDGWGCSVSGFCRAPTGAFASASEPLSAGVSAMLVGDFDGDGRKDILGTTGESSTAARGRVHFFGDGGALSQVVALPGVLTSPYVRDFDGDGRDDFAFGFSARILGADITGIGLMHGQADRTLSPKVFPSFKRDGFDALFVPLVTTVQLASGPQDLLAVAATGGADGKIANALVSLDDDLATNKGLHLALAGGPSDVVGATSSATIFDADPTSTCGEVVIAIAPSGGSPVVNVVSPCRTVGGQKVWARDRAPLALAAPGAKLGGAFVADVDGNGHRDVLVESDGTVYVAANATGAPPLGPLTPIAAWAGATATARALRELPLAAGDLDADGVLDFVVPSGVVMSKPGADGGAGAGWTQIPVPTKTWTRALVADVNDDGALDVVGASDVDPDLDVLEGTRSMFLPAFTVTTSAPVRQLVVGDFDFDSVPDIAFSARRVGGDDDELAIAYGKLTMPPEAPRTVGRIADVRQVLSSPAGLTITTELPPSSGSTVPGISVAVLLESGERQPLAPLIFDDRLAQPSGSPPKNASRTWFANAVVAASLGAPGQTDIIALASGVTRDADGAPLGAPARGVWLAAGGAGETFATPVEVADLGLSGVAARGGRDLLVEPSAGDLDGDGLAELVVVGPDPAGNAQISVVSSAIVKSKGSLEPVPLPGWKVPSTPRSALLDVDGDGALDLVAALADASGATKVNVFFGDGKQGFAPQAAVVALPANASGASPIPLGIAQVTTAGAPSAVAVGGARRELAIATPKALYRVPFAGRSMEPATEVPVAGGLVYGSSVAAGDFDGDGVEDLAVADSGSIRMLLQKARHP